MGECPLCGKRFELVYFHILREHGREALSKILELLWLTATKIGEKEKLNFYMEEKVVVRYNVESLSCTVEDFRYIPPPAHYYFEEADVG